MENEVLRNTSNTETVTISRAEYEDLVNQNRWLMEQLQLLKKAQFGSTSEKAHDEVYGQMMLFDEPEVYAYLEECELRKSTVAKHERTKKERKFILDKIPEGTEVVIEEHRLTEEERLCPNCGNILEEIGKNIVRTLKIIPAKFMVQEDHYFTYACKKCSQDTETDNRTQIIETPHVPSVYPGSYASPSAVAYLMAQKYMLGTPLYRMEADFQSLGYRLSRQTMSNWMIHCSETWLRPLYDELHRRLVAKDIIHADETELQVLHEPGRKAEAKSYMWLYRTGKYEEHPIVLYEYRPGRSGSYPAEFLEGFHGYLQTDGYSGYDLVPDVIHVGCMAHMRRKFHDAVSTLPPGKRTGAAVEGEAFCSKLFQLEESYADLTPEQRQEKRMNLSKPIFDQFVQWGSTRHAAQKSKLGIALTYLNNNSKELGAFLENGRLEISNNLAERSIKPFVIDRKNFLFANTPKGADSSAVTFSIIETARANNLNPFKYLSYVFTTAPVLKQKGEDWITPLLPENVPDDCHRK